MDLNDLLRDGSVSLEAFLEAAERETPIAAEETALELARRGLAVLREVATTHLRDRQHACEVLEGLASRIVELGFAARLAASETDALLLQIGQRTPRGAKDGAKDLIRTIRREAKRQTDALRSRAPAAGRAGPDPAVWDRLPKSDSGAPISSFGAVCIVLEQDPTWKGRLSFCDFRFRSLLDGKPIEDNDVRTIRRWLEDVYAIRVGTTDTGEAVELLAGQTRVHPIREYLEGLVWDGVPRAGRLCERYFGAGDGLPAEPGPRHALFEAYSRCFLVAAVARVYQPGIKADTVLVFSGGQGLGKSTGLKVLCGGYFRDSHMDIGNKDAFQLLQGAWIYELAEFAPLSKRDHASVRNFLSSANDSYRPPFGKHPIDVPRQAVFAATANPEPGRGLLTDPTGSRRYWVVDVAGPVDVEALRADRDQLWAEAVALFRGGAAHWLPADLEIERRAANEAHQDVDPNLDAMRLVLRQRKSETPSWEEPRMTSQQLLTDACGVPPDRARGAILRDAVAALKAEGWRHAFRRGVGWVYVPV